eukprot:2384355-Amphidinium_carterae.2
MQVADTYLRYRALALPASLVNTVLHPDNKDLIEHFPSKLVSGTYGSLHRRVVARHAVDKSNPLNQCPFWWHASNLLKVPMVVGQRPWIRAVLLTNALSQNYVILRCAPQMMEWADHSLQHVVHGSLTCGAVMLARECRTK